ncbi:MAG: ABC transporter substrate-binding protein [Deltaproteobacteria bacterium]|nr:ABC transporter substrate-binding protein [Deltaproteobacteria bacterium]
MKRKLILVLALVLALALSLAGLGLAGPAAAAEPIKIGAFFALSGPGASIGTPTKLVALMVVDHINKNGGINGRPLELVLGDTEGEPTKAVMVFKKFATLDKVVAVIGPTRTGTGMAVKKQIEAAHIPTVMTVGGDPVIMEGKHGKMDFGTARWVFKAPQRSSVAVQKVLDYLKKKGMTKVAVLTAGDGFGRDGARWLAKLAPAAGITIVAEEQFNPSDVDMKSQLTKLAAAKPEAFICWTIGPAGAIVSKNHHALGLKAPLVQCHGLPGERYLQLAGEAAEGDLMPGTKLMAWQALPDSDPQKKVIAEFVHLYNDVYKYNEKYPLDTHSGYAWDAVYLLAGAMQKAGTDPDKLRDALENTKDYVGISGVYNLSPTDHNGLGTDSMIMLEVKGGKFVMAD